MRLVTCVRVKRGTKRSTRSVNGRMIVGQERRKMQERKETKGKQSDAQDPGRVVGYVYERETEESDGRTGNTVS